MPQISTKSAFQFKTVSVAGTAIAMVADLGFTAEELAAAHHARITNGANPIRFRYDGTAPTSSVGHYMAANETIIIDGSDNIAKLQFIQVSTGSTVFITLER